MLQNVVSLYFSFYRDQDLAYLSSLPPLFTGKEEMQWQWGLSLCVLHCYYNIYTSHNFRKVITSGMD